MPETRRPVVGMDALVVWCRRWLGAPPTAELFEAGYLSTVRGLRLADGRKPEPAIAGLAAASFLGIDDPARLASVEDSAAFLDAYQHACGRRWIPADYAACRAAGLWQQAFDAKTRSLDGDPEQILTRCEARTRLRLAGLNPDPAA